LHLKDLPFAIQRKTWQQYDRAPPHFGRKLMELSNKNYEGIWSGRNRLEAWPTQSNDLSPLDFFLLGCM